MTCVDVLCSNLTGYSTSSLPSLLSEIYTHVCRSTHKPTVHPLMAKHLLLSQEKSRDLTLAMKSSTATPTTRADSNGAVIGRHDEDEYSSGGSISSTGSSRRRIIRIGVVSGSFDSIPGMVLNMRTL